VISGIRSRIKQVQRDPKASENGNSVANTSCVVSKKEEGIELQLTNAYKTCNAYCTSPKPTSVFGHAGLNSESIVGNAFRRLLCLGDFDEA
jgi:hypothetical protein